MTMPQITKLWLLQMATITKLALTKDITHLREKFSNLLNIYMKQTKLL